MRTSIVMAAIVWFSGDAFAACGSRGGPAFLGPDGKCVGWAAMDRVCGTPPTSRCTYEGGGVGDTGQEKGNAFIATILPGASALAAGTEASNFNKRAVKQDGFACTSQGVMARVASCVLGRASPDCNAQVDETLKKGECARLPAGTQVTIEAGSHSFEWVRFRAPGQAAALWSPRQLVLD